jgi:hypothetical protein
MIWYWQYKPHRFVNKPWRQWEVQGTEKNLSAFLPSALGGRERAAAHSYGLITGNELAVVTPLWTGSAPCPLGASAGKHMTIACSYSAQLGYSESVKKRALYSSRKASGEALSSKIRQYCSLLCVIWLRRLIKNASPFLFDVFN